MPEKWFMIINKLLNTGVDGAKGQYVPTERKSRWLKAFSGPHIILISHRSFSGRRICYPNLKKWRKMTKDNSLVGLDG